MIFELSFYNENNLVDKIDASLKSLNKLVIPLVSQRLPKEIEKSIAFKKRHMAPNDGYGDKVETPIVKRYKRLNEPELNRKKTVR